MSDARPRSVSRQGSFDNQLHMNLDFIEPGTHELPSTPAPSSRCMEDIAGYIFTSNGSQDDLKVLDGLLYGVADINAFVMAKIGGKIAGLYGEVYLNQIIYSIKKNEGSAATLVHYGLICSCNFLRYVIAAINGNTDILNLLIKHGVCFLSLFYCLL